MQHRALDRSKSINQQYFNDDADVDDDGDDDDYYNNNIICNIKVKV